MRDGQLGDLRQIRHESFHARIADEARDLGNASADALPTPQLILKCVERDIREAVDMFRHQWLPVMRITSA